MVLIPQPIYKMALAGLLFVLPLIAASSMAQERSITSTHTEDLVRNPIDISRLPQTQSMAILDKVQQRPMRIDGTANVVNIGWGSRFDQLPVAGELKLNFRYSPSLLAGTSQVNILLNSETIHSIALDPASANQKHQLTVELDADLMTDYNQLKFELIAKSAAAVCPAPDASTWFEITSGSTIDLNYQRLPIANELAYFPEPFFYAAEFSDVHIPFYLPAQLSADWLASSATLASYFGAMANWRSIELPTVEYSQHYSNRGDWLTNWQPKHSIVFVTNEIRPAAYADLPRVDKPQVRMVDNPKYPGVKVLLVMAPVASQLQQAVNGLALSDNSLSGDTAYFSQLPLSPREAYQAPNWLTTDRPVAFSELVNDASELQRSGREQAPIQIPLRLPPDLLLWQRSEIPLNLDYRYTPPVSGDDSRLLVSINNEFIKAYSLEESGVQDSSDRLAIPLIESSLLGPEQLRIPAFKLSVLNQLGFSFKFSQVGSNCEFIPANSTRAAIDGTSTVDITGFSHYTAMPNLHLFAKAGYPFTRYDDLSRTLVVLPEAPNKAERDLLLTNFARFGASTGYPATHAKVSLQATVDDSQRQDILVIGRRAVQQWLTVHGQDELDKQLAAHALAGRQDLFERPDWVMQNTGNTAAVASFKSADTKTGTVVLQTATTAEDLERLRQQLNTPAEADEFSGFLTLSTAAGLESYDATQRYYVGNLTYWSRMKYHAAQQPVLIVILVVMAVFVLALGIYRVLRQRAIKRQQQSSGH